MTETKKKTRLNLKLLQSDEIREQFNDTLKATIAEENGPVSVDKWQEIIVDTTKKVCTLISIISYWYTSAEMKLDTISSQ